MAGKTTFCSHTTQTKCGLARVSTHAERGKFVKRRVIPYCRSGCVKKLHKPSAGTQYVADRLLRGHRSAFGPELFKACLVELAPRRGDVGILFGLFRGQNPLNPQGNAERLGGAEEAYAALDATCGDGKTRLECSTRAIAAPWARPCAALVWFRHAWCPPVPRSAAFPPSGRAPVGERSRLALRVPRSPFGSRRACSARRGTLQGRPGPLRTPDSDCGSWRGCMVPLQRREAWVRAWVRAWVACGPKKQPVRE